MSLQGIEKFVQSLYADEQIWNNYSLPIPRGCCVIAKSSTDEDEYIFKIGDGNSLYKQLPIFMRFSRIIEAYHLKHIYFDYNIEKNKILYYDIDEDDIRNIKPTEYTVADILNYLNDAVSLKYKHNILLPQIIGPTKIKIGDTVTYTVKAYDILERSGIKIVDAEWVDNDNNVSNGLELEISVPVDINLVGTQYSIKVKVKDQYGNWSRKVTFNIDIVDDQTTSYIKDINYGLLEFIVKEPKLVRASWNENTHHSNTQYELTVEGEDPNHLSLFYELECNDDSVIIEKSPEYPNKFIITYPEYTEPTIVTYFITISNVEGYSIMNLLEKKVLP